MSKIRTADGREWDIDQLMRQRTRPTTVNLRTGRQHRPRRIEPYYTWEERSWQAQATVADMQARYDITAAQARSRSWQARQMLRRQVDYGPGPWANLNKDQKKPE